LYSFDKVNSSFRTDWSQLFSVAVKFLFDTTKIKEKDKLDLQLTVVIGYVSYLHVDNLEIPG